VGDTTRLLPVTDVICAKRSKEKGRAKRLVKQGGRKLRVSNNYLRKK